MSRLELHALLVELLGSTNVYYEPPETLKMSYPAIRYQRTNIRSKRADNSNYSVFYCYEIVVISKDPDISVVEKLLEVPYCTHDRHYRASNLHHNVFTLYC
jgi:hypothetical protein